ncbi:hypothetical protein CEXT_633921 [Caerostris extrusa]|uniref:Uncharacterized protein n=1 Tax=Caerostris extrusa TaxID=172846 RepID=A0AAV4Y755_CAEEX|nr:hypothetical protein CEXT_633921 [Caerostris extrusa]
MHYKLRNNVDSNSPFQLPDLEKKKKSSQQPARTKWADSSRVFFLGNSDGKRELRRRLPVPRQLRLCFCLLIRSPFLSLASNLCCGRRPRHCFIRSPFSRAIKQSPAEPNSAVGRIKGNAAAVRAGGSRFLNEEKVRV